MSGNKTKLWIVSELYKPSNTSTAHILVQVADFLAEEYDIHVIAGKSASHMYGLNENNQISPAENILYINSPFVRNKILRIIFGLYFSIKATIYLMRLSKSGDKILAVTNPQTLILVLPWFFGKNLTFLIHDIFPDNLIKTSNGIGRWLGNFLNPFYNSSYRHLFNAIVLGEDMKQVVAQKRVKNIQIIRNWADEDLKIKPFPKGRIKILYAGNIGRLQGLHDFIIWFKQLDERLFELHIRGEGEAKHDLICAVKELGMRNVYFHGAFKRNEQSDILGMCHFGLVSLDNKMFGLGVPSKFYNIIKSGRPVLYFGPKHTEVYNSVQNDSLGLILDNIFSYKEFSHKMEVLIQEVSPEYYANIYEMKYSKEAVKRQLINYFRTNG